MQTQEEKDAELRMLASSAVEPSTGEPIPPQPGAGPNAMGLDLSSLDTPNQPSPKAPDGTPIVPDSQGTTSDDTSVAATIKEAQSEPGPKEPLPAPEPVLPSSRPPSTPTEKGSVEALNQARKSGYEAANAKAAESAPLVAKSEAEAEGIRKSSEQHQKDAEEIQAKQAAIEDGRQKAEAIREAAYKDFKDFKPYNFWRDGSDWDHIQAKVAVMLGAWGNSGPYAATTHNAALDSINANIDRQHKIDEMEVRKRFDIAKLREQGAQQFEANMQNDLALMKFKQSATSLAVADEIKAQLIDSGIPLEAAQNNTAVKQMIAKADQADAEGYEKLMAVHGNLALNRAKMDASRPDAPYIQNVAAEWLKEHPGDQAGAMQAATRAGSKDPTKTVQPLIKESDKIEAEKNKALAKVGNASAALRKERIVANINDMTENLKEVKPGVITPEVLAKVQQNETDMRAMSEPHGALDAIGNKLSRTVGVMAKSPYDGLTPEQADSMKSLDMALLHGSEMQQAQGEGVKKDFYSKYRPQPGMDQSSIDRSIESLHKEAKAYSAILDQGGKIASRAAVKDGSPKFAPGSKVTVKGKIYTVGSDGDELIEDK